MVGVGEVAAEGEQLPGLFQFLVNGCLAQRQRFLVQVPEQYNVLAEFL